MEELNPLFEAGQVLHRLMRSQHADGVRVQCDRPGRQAEASCSFYDEADEVLMTAMDAVKVADSKSRRPAGLKAVELLCGKLTHGPSTRMVIVWKW
jgi:hypothetical protein